MLPKRLAHDALYDPLDQFQAKVNISSFFGVCDTGSRVIAPINGCPIVYITGEYFAKMARSLIRKPLAESAVEWVSEPAGLT